MKLTVGLTNIDSGVCGANFPIFCRSDFLFLFQMRKKNLGLVDNYLCSTKVFAQSGRDCEGN